MLTTKLRDETVKRLKDRPASLKLKNIAETTGIPEGWLKMLAQNKIEDPGVNRIETLYTFLTNNKLL